MDIMMPVLGMGLFICGVFMCDLYEEDVRKEVISSMVMFVGMMVVIAWLLTYGTRFAG